MTNVMPIVTNDQQISQLIMAAKISMLIALLGVILFAYALNARARYSKNTKTLSIIGISIVVAGFLLSGIFGGIATHKDTLPADQVEQYYGISDFEVQKTGLFGKTSYDSGIDKIDYGIHDVRFNDGKNNTYSGRITVKENKIILSVKSSDQYKPYNVVKK